MRDKIPAPHRGKATTKKEKASFGQILNAFGEKHKTAF
jgi:hypothetical protein